MAIHCDLQAKIVALAEKFPVVTLTRKPQPLRLTTRGLTPGMMVLSLETNGTRAACKVINQLQP